MASLMISDGHKESKMPFKWVLVKDRLPEDPGYYWVTMRHLDGTLTTEKYFWTPEELCRDAGDEVVVAWQPYFFPEPYRSDVSDQVGACEGPGD